jgi:hypothetical protein
MNGSAGSWFAACFSGRSVGDAGGSACGPSVVVGQPVWLVDPVDPQTTGRGSLSTVFSVSCPTTTACNAVSGWEAGLAEQWDGTNWTIQPTMNFGAPTVQKRETILVGPGGTWIRLVEVVEECGQASHGGPR